MSNFMMKILDNVKSRVKKQKYRRKIYLTSEFYFDTFDSSDGTLKLYSIMGGEIYWWKIIDLIIVKQLVISINEAFLRSTGVTNVSFPKGSFYIKKDPDGVLIEIIFTDLFSRIVSQSVRLQRPLTAETLDEVASL